MGKHTLTKKMNTDLTIANVTRNSTSLVTSGVAQKPLRLSVFPVIHLCHVHELPSHINLWALFL
jgi:hypothetical protein